MSTRDSTHGRKAEPGSTFRGGKKWVEDAAKIFFADSATVVRNFDHSFFANLFIFLLAEPYTDVTFILDRFDRVDNQIQHRIFDLRRIGIQHDVLSRSLKFDMDPTPTCSRADCL